MTISSLSLPSRWVCFSTLSLALALAVPARPVAAADKLPLNTLIVSGGPNPNYNQYAIESNARYVEKLTDDAAARHILFADGTKTTPTISVVETTPDEEEQAIFAWLFRLPPVKDKVTFKPSGLEQIDGPATNDSVKQNIGWLEDQAKNGQTSLLYYTGHDSPGVKPRDPAQGGGRVADTQNTVYALWNNQNISVQETAAALKDWPQGTPLVVVMVQCYSGGFANLMFEGGDPTKPLLDRNFCGFFAATGERMASGCTSQVNETDYQDFTTHFFAALSGISRDGKKIKGADYDKNGTVSMLEALAWTELYDQSIDVPVCTSDAYLRSVYPAADPPSWAQTSYASVLKAAAPWQKAILEGLSQELKLKGDVRIADAIKIRDDSQSAMAGRAPQTPTDVDPKATQALYDQLKADLLNRFPDLKNSVKPGDPMPGRAEAVVYLATRKADVDKLSAVLEKMGEANGEASTQEALAWRFIRASRTVLLEQRLMKEGTDAQKAAFARFRKAEATNPLKG